MPTYHDIASETTHQLIHQDLQQIKLAIQPDTISVYRGGTGVTAVPENALLVGDGTDPLVPLPSASGALYATSANGAPRYGTLPVAQGGTGVATVPANALLVGDGNGPLGALPSASGALYATSANGAPQYGTLPVAQGGTGATTGADALQNLGIATIVADIDVELDGVAALEEYERQLACNVYPGRDLEVVLADEIEEAGSVWAALHARASAGSFDGLRIGDWMDVPLTARSGTVTQSTVRYAIAAFDHYYLCADTALGHHIVFVPTAPIDMTGSSYATNTSYIMWNTTATNQGNNTATAGSMSSNANPYLISNLHKWEINEFLTKLPSELQGYLLDFRDLVESRYASGSSLTASTGWAWQNIGKIWSPSEMEVYGCRVWGTSGFSQGMGSQFPIFRETRDRIMGTRATWWLRVVSGSSASNVCHVALAGSAYYTSAAYAWLRPWPCFLLG